MRESSSPSLESSRGGGLVADRSNTRLPLVSRTIVAERNRPRRSPRLFLLVFVSTLVLLTFAAFAWVPSRTNDEMPATSESQVKLVLNLICQFRDTNMQCVPDGPSCPPAGAAHPWNDAKGLDGVYGSADDCPHCSCYCAPASIAMIASYRGMVGPKIQQDNIYDNGKSSGEAGVGDNILSTHGVGMFDGTGGMPAEVQASFLWSVGVFTQHDHVPANPNGPMTAVKLVQYLYYGHPVLWLDHGGWPKNQSGTYPSLTDRQFEGHAKVISGYDDNGTLANTSDDLCLIYDPWPEYSDLSVLPSNATLGPGGSYDPYWLPTSEVNFSDVSDIYLVDGFPDIAEFQEILIPVVGMVVIVAACMAHRRVHRK